MRDKGKGRRMKDEGSAGLCSSISVGPHRRSWGTNGSREASLAFNPLKSANRCGFRGEGKMSHISIHKNR